MQMYKDREMAILLLHDTKGVYFPSPSADLMQVYGVHVQKTFGGEKELISISAIQLMYFKYMRGLNMQDEVRDHSLHKSIQKMVVHDIFLLFGHYINKHLSHAQRNLDY